MTFAQFLFVAIDKLFDGGQNKKKMLRFKDVKFEIETDVPYTEGEYCKLDTYYVKKDSDEKYPVFFYIHGGGFVAGDKYHRRGLAKWAAAKGFFVVNVNYGLGPKELFPLGLQQLVMALNWVGQNAEKYNLDLDNMCVSGDSAGGYYSAMLGCICGNRELQQRFGVSTTLRFRTALLDCGIYDIDEALSHKMPFRLTDRICHDFTGKHTKELDEYEWTDVLSPLKLVDANFPISFITYAEKDMFCKGQGQRLIETLQGLGVHVESHHSTKFMDNHCYPLNWNKGAAIENIKLSDDFLKRVVNKEV